MAKAGTPQRLLASAAVVTPGSACAAKTMSAASAASASCWVRLDDGMLLMGIDLDSCIDDTGTISDWASGVLTKFNSYAEVSPNGRGSRDCHRHSTTIQ